MDDTTLSAFLDWLDSQRSNGVSVTTVGQVLGGERLPQVVVAQPGTGSTVFTSTPRISGSAAPAGSNVTVQVYRGPDTTGQLLQTSAVTNNAGSWATTAVALADGMYTVQARQTLNGAEGVSAPSTFTVQTAAVTIDSPSSGATVTTSTLNVSGAAGTQSGNSSAVTLRMYAGSSTVGTLLATVNAPLSAGAWSVALTGLNVGTYTLQASQADAAGNTTACPPVTFVVRSSMTVTSVTPSTAGRGATGRLLTLRGSGFVAGTTGSFTGTGITSGTPTVVDATTLTIPINVAANAPLGARTLTLNRSGEFSATCVGCLTVNTAPSATSLSPSGLAQGVSAASVRLNGSNVVAGAAVTFSGTGVRATIVTFRIGSVQLPVDVDASAATGPRDVVIENADGGRATCVGCFTVAPKPTIASITPSSVARNVSVVVTISGTGFAGTPTATFSGSGVTATKVTLVDSGTLRVTVKTAKNAATGPRDVTIQNSTNLGTATVTAGLRVS